MSDTLPSWLGAAQTARADEHEVRVGLLGGLRDPPAFAAPGPVQQRYGRPPSGAGQRDTRRNKSRSLALTFPLDHRDQVIDVLSVGATAGALCHWQMAAPIGKRSTHAPLGTVTRLHQSRQPPPTSRRTP
jgi:hypothetical protein